MNKPNREKVLPPKQRKRERTSDAGETTVPATGDAEAERQQQLAFARVVHGPVSGGITYAAISKHLQPCSAFAETAQQFTADFIQRVAPRDPLEELLAIQMLYSHARVGYLSTQATQ